MPSRYNIESKIFWWYCIIIVRALGTGFLHVLSPLNQLDFGACAYRMTSSPILPRPSKTLSLALDNCVEMSISSIQEREPIHFPKSPNSKSSCATFSIPRLLSFYIASPSNKRGLISCIACGGGDSRHTLCSHIFLPSFLQCSHLPPFSDWLSDIVFYACL
jgi:hypothetical protein